MCLRTLGLKPHLFTRERWLSDSYKQFCAGKCKKNLQHFCIRGLSGSKSIHIIPRPCVGHVGFQHLPNNGIDCGNLWSGTRGSKATLEKKARTSPPVTRLFVVPVLKRPGSSREQVLQPLSARSHWRGCAVYPHRSRARYGDVVSQEAARERQRGEEREFDGGWCFDLDLKARAGHGKSAQARS
jgi:hypothetical protein